MGILIAGLLNDSRPPPIAQGAITKEDWPHFEAASRKLTEVLQSKFPVRSREDILKSILLDQGFRPIEPPPSNCIPPGQQGAGRGGLLPVFDSGFSDRPKPIMSGTMTRRPAAISGFTNFR